MTAAEKEVAAVERKRQPNPDTTGSLVLPEWLASGASSSSAVDSAAVDSAASPANGKNIRAQKVKSHQINKNVSYVYYW